MINRIKVHRVISNLTQQQLADKIGISRQTVIAIESDKYLPSLGLAYRLAIFFQVAIEDLFIYEESQKQR